MLSSIHFFIAKKWICPTDEKHRHHQLSSLANSICRNVIMLTHQKGEKNKGTTSRNPQNEIIVDIVRTYSACPAGCGVIFDGFTCQRLIIIQLSLYVTKQMGFLLLLTRENHSPQKNKTHLSKIDGIKVFLLYFTSEDRNNQYLLQAVIGNQYFCSKTVDPNISPIASVPNKQISF